MAYLRFAAAIVLAIFCKFRFCWPRLQLSRLLAGKQVFVTCFQTVLAAANGETQKPILTNEKKLINKLRNEYPEKIGRPLGDDINQTVTIYLRLQLIQIVALVSGHFWSRVKVILISSPSVALERTRSTNSSRPTFGANT